MNNIILVDLDDTINDLTGDMCKAFDSDMPRLTLDNILNNKVPAGFQSHRKEFLNRKDVWGCPPTGVGASIIPTINADKRLRAVICTKTPVKYGAEGVASTKVKVCHEHYPNNTALLVIGKKSDVAAKGIIDDLKGNCLDHNKVHNSQYLIFEHGRTTEGHLKMFLTACNYNVTKEQENSLVVVKYKDGVVKFKRSDSHGVGFPCGSIELGESSYEAAERELYEETGIKLDEDDKLEYYGSVPSATGENVHMYFIDLSHRESLQLNDNPVEFKREGVAYLCKEKEVGNIHDTHYVFNNILMHNLKLGG